MRRLLASVVWLACASMASAQANPFEQPAPLPLVDWMKPGTRLVYYASRSESAAWTVRLVPDANGRWMDPDNPKVRYSEEDVLNLGREPGEIHQQGGYGARQNDVVAVEPDGTIAVDVKLFAARPDLNALVLQPGGEGVVGSVEQGPSLWIHPQKLARMLADAEAKGLPDPKAEQRVYRVVYTTVDNRQIPALRLVMLNGASHVQQTYDLASGLLLVESSLTSNGGGPVLVDGAGGRYQSHRGGVANYKRLVSVRTLRLPADAAAAPLPPLFGQPGRQFAWQGGYKMQAGLDPVLDAQLPPSPLAFACQTVKSGRSFAQMTVVDVSPGALPAPRPDARVVGPADIGGLIVTPALFAELAPGATLDEDPVTRNKVTFLGARPDGLVGVEERGPAHQFVYGYDPRTGAMRTMWYTVGGTNLYYSLQLVER